ncbi:MAG: hypothetical protein HND57_06900 [Planctomycetes bacterium]|nr:hypothetical protein [Planctomycetota bacterium]
MRTDHTTYSLATRISFVGLALQALAALALLLFGLGVKDDLSLAASYYALMGLPIWLVLIVVFHQHKLERIEAMEARELEEESGRSQSIFDRHEEDLQVAARRLRLMYRILLPGASLLVAAGQMGIGFWQLKLLRAKLQGAPTGGPEVAQLLLPGSDWAPWGLVLGAAKAVILFIFSRYVAGRSKQPAWRSLRGGATTAVGVALVGVLLAIADGFLIKESRVAAEILASALPIYILAVGIEIAANFVLNVYTPRRPGEYPRPAFDSRILSLLAAPDTVVKSISDAINYQFGFEVTSTWFYKLLSRQLAPLFAFCIAVLVVLNCASVVNPSEQAIILSFGGFARTAENEPPRVFESGLLFKWPWERVEKYPVHLVQTVDVGRKPRDEPTRPILWTKPHTSETEDLIIVAPAAFERAYTGENLDNPVAQNYSVLNMYIPVHFKIKPDVDDNGQHGLINYINFQSGSDISRRKYIQLVATRVITKHLATVPIDQVLGPLRSSLATTLRSQIQSALDDVDSGIQVVFVGIAGIHPPVGDEESKVAESFEQVLQAQEERAMTIEQARSEAIQILARIAGTQSTAQQIAAAVSHLRTLSPDSTEFEEQNTEVQRLLLQAGGDAAKTILDAQAQRWSKHMGQLAVTTRHNGRLGRTVRLPTCTWLRSTCTATARP